MLIILVAVIIDWQLWEYFYFGIGDSLIFKFEEGVMEELILECEFCIQFDLLLFRVKSGGFLKEGICFVLMFDGIFMNWKNYKQEIVFVLGFENWESKFDEIMYLNQLI